ncbi:methanogen output domain 1-containing protein [Salirhabdus salicampi]|uniref:methanogen output domain 1-containing protein n=1 Tax=Salirhabdus salicampi TaxID=476102 RepID=UPI0020C3F44B|nr:methanogen output domain 1-containing protein [Salirhabdus salicampi]MCP8616157.1 methanogen output domain 1-containing protein [Salirhabdus salicampi]
MQEQSLSGIRFLIKLITQYAKIHERTIGSTAEEYIRQLGIRQGEWIESFYSDKSEDWSVEKYADIIVDLKNSIGGHFTIKEVHPDHVVVKATGCPFGEAVKEAPHLCKMTSSVFGGMAARRFGYGMVSLRKRIAVGDNGCEVAVYFKPTDKEEGDIYKDLPITPENGNPFEWEEDTITLLHENLKRSDDMIQDLLEEIEHLRAKVKETDVQ